MEATKIEETAANHTRHVPRRPLALNVSGTNEIGHSLSLSVVADAQLGHGETRFKSTSQPTQFNLLPVFDTDQLLSDHITWSQTPPWVSCFEINPPYLQETGVSQYEFPQPLFLTMVQEHSMLYAGLNEAFPLSQPVTVGENFFSPAPFTVPYENYLPEVPKFASSSHAPFIAQPEAPNVQEVPPVFAASSQAQVICLQDGCWVNFKRDSDRIRHESAVHGINRPLHLCSVQGCPKSIGAGYTRKDKLTEHMWKKHANLGFTKRA